MNPTAMLLAAVIAAPASASLIALLPGMRGAARHLGAAGGAIASLASIALAVAVLVGGEQTPIRLGSGGGLWFGVVGNSLTVLLLLLVSFVNAVVQVFARRQLLGDAGGPRFAIRSGLLISATAVMVSASSVITLAIGWTLAGLALIALVSVYWPQPAARDAARQTTRMVLVGDGALWLAVGLHAVNGGTQSMSELTPAPHAGPVTGAVIASLLVIAAAARCAQMPFHRWLTASLAAPTPVSAILHAGVVNAGGILLVRLYPLVGGSWTATALTFAVAAAGTIAATLMMLARPDVKGALVHSTIAQMAFLLLACSMGLLAAAVSHLIAHGMFKSTLFLGSTSSVAAHVRQQDEPVLADPSRGRAVALALLSILIAAASVAGAAVVLRPESTASGAVLMAFAAVTAAAAGWGWIRRRPTGSGAAILIVAVPLLAGGYLAILTGITRLLDPVLAPAGAAAAPAWGFAAVLAALLLAWSAPARTTQRGRIRDWLYVRVLAAGQPSSFAPRSATAPLLLPVPVPPLRHPSSAENVPERAIPTPSSREGVRL